MKRSTFKYFQEYLKKESIEFDCIYKIKNHDQNYLDISQILIDFDFKDESNFSRCLVF